MGSGAGTRGPARRGHGADSARQLEFYPRDDLEVRCYAAFMSAERGQEARLGELDWMWLEPQELPDGCAKLVQKMLDEEKITVTDVWRRVRLLFARGQITAAKTTLGYPDKPDSPDQRLLADAARQPKRVLERLPRSLERRSTREVVVLGVLRYARNDPQPAAPILEK